MARYNVHAGHCPQSTGAGGQFDEMLENRRVKDLVIKHLRDAGHTVYDCTDDDGTSLLDNLQRIVRKCNAHPVDLDVSIHFNSFNGEAHGTEVHVFPGTTAATAAAKRIVDNIAELGYTNRGVKETNLHVLRETTSPALLIECCFCDSVTDAKIYKVDTMARAIADGIMGEASAAPAPVEKEDGMLSHACIVESDGRRYLWNGVGLHLIKTEMEMVSICGIYEKGGAKLPTYTFSDPMSVQRIMDVLDR